ncbi:MAG: formate dehydrogenase accessory protein FdhE [Chloroflexi bacterium]|nr:formate dehydrogenase accessory protein FdhE [Chloroflexota bacterium]
MESSLRARIAALTEQADPSLRDEIRLRGTLIQLLDRGEVVVPEPRLPAVLVRARLANGTPLLDGLNLPISPTTLSLFERLTVAMLADEAAQPAAEAILTAARTHRIHAEQVIGEAIVHHGDHLAALAQAAGLFEPLVSTLADLAARPLLAAVAERLRPALRLGPWRHGWCPICGARPLFAEADAAHADAEAGAVHPDAEAGAVHPDAEADAVHPDTDDEHAHLRCGRCAAAWACSLPVCPACSGGELSVIAAQEFDGAGAWSVLGCSACRAYLKVAAAPRPAALARLLADDLATWTLDRDALAAGFQRSAAPPRRLEHADLAGEDHDDD